MIFLIRLFIVSVFTLLFYNCQELFFPKPVSFIVALFMHSGNKIKSFNDLIKGALDENL
jgi:hypothetical protein